MLLFLHFAHAHSSGLTVSPTAPGSSRWNRNDRTPFWTKKVCVEERRNNGQVKQVCKTIKVHKKLDGTPVPNQKK